MKTRFVSVNPLSRWQSELERFIRFGAIGFSGTLLNFAILSALKHFLGWPTLPANLISYACGILNNYLLTRLWVYPEARERQRFVQLLQFVLISLVGLGLNNLLVLALEKPLGALLANPVYGYLPAKLVATFIVLLWNFFANRFWTFGKIAKLDHKAAG
jgi:putative flippase GtrA